MCLLAVEHAGVLLMIVALRDVEANVRNLRGYVVRFQKSKAAVEEYENLSETIIGAMKGYDADILVVRRKLPTKPLEGLKEKARWALKKREIQELLGRITQRNSSLTTALGIMERYHLASLYRHKLMVCSQQSLHIRNNTQNILAKQTASDIFASRNYADIDSKMQKQKEDHAELLSYLRNITSSIDSIRASSTRQHKTLTLAATQQAALMNDRLKRIDKSSSRLARNTKQANIKLDELRNQLQHSSKQTQQTVNAMITGTKGIHAKAIFSASSVDTITRIVREEIKSTITPLIEEAFNRNQAHREEALRHLGTLNNTITHEIGSDVSAQRMVEPSNLHALNTTRSNEYLTNRKIVEPWRMQCRSNIAQSPTIYQDNTTIRQTVSIYKRRWSHQSRFGTLKIKVEHIHHRTNGAPHSKNYISVEVHFWPAQTYLNLSGISAFYSTVPTPEGYYQLAPVIAI